MGRMPPAALSLSEARRLALAAQGIGRPSRASVGRTVTMAGVREQIDRLGLFQIDTVNVVARAHLLPLFTRLGPYDPALLERAANGRPRRLFEYWGHEASLIDIALYPAWRWKMADAERHAWGRMRAIQRDRPHLVAEILAAVAERGPLTARHLEDATPRERTNWGWNWSEAKTALEWLFYCGEVACAGRTAQFERVYDLPERVIPAAILARGALGRAEAHRVLAGRALSALGVATTAHLADYFRLRPPEVAAALAGLAADGLALPVAVEGWRQGAWLAPASREPRRVRASCLVSPFDSLVFHRARLAELFGADYRIEIYTPTAKRRWGYYVYLFLLGEAFAARVDLKADRAGGALLVRAAWREPGALVDDEAVSHGLAAELARLAAWLGLERIVVEPRGDLAGALGRAVAAGLTQRAEA